MAACAWCRAAADEPAWPALSETDGELVLPAQEWPREPGPRTVTAHIRYPGGTIEGVGDATGIMLSLHCWSCEGWAASADPAVLAERLNVVGIAVDYLQTGEYDPKTNPLPYDYGSLQALDALRALYFVYQGLQDRGIAFDHGRIYAGGGSGGGNVSLMANKLAPRTFAAIVDMCGMAKLNDDIAYGLPEGSRANACYSADPESPRYLTPDAQLLRFAGYPPHLKTMKDLGNSAKVIIIHGTDDDLIPCDESRELATNMNQVQLDVEPHFLVASDVDGTAVQSTGHLLGDWGAIVFRYGEKYLDPQAPTVIRRAGPTDFDVRDEAVRYQTPSGAYVISYRAGYPVGRFEPHNGSNAGE
jgi:hypothetical protein